MERVDRARLTLLFFCFCSAYGAIIINLFFIQVKNGAFYKEKAFQQYTYVLEQYPERALITDRYNNPLALNRPSYTAFTIPYLIHTNRRTLAFLQAHFPSAYETIIHNPYKQFIFIKRHLSSEQLDLIQTNSVEGIHLLQEEGRYYPQSSMSTIVGITDVDNKGIAGIEYTHNARLIGSPAICTLEKDARSGTYYFHKNETNNAMQGTPIQLTIDSKLQFLVHQELLDTMHTLTAQEAAAVIMDPSNGHILSMVSIPDFDPNQRGPLIIDHMKNRVITETYELGSVMKVFSALASLEEKIVTADQLIDCKNKKTWHLDGRKINTVKAHGIIPFSDVIAFSNNIGIAQVVKYLDRRLYDHYIRIGFGKKTGIALPGEQKGFINDPAHWSKQSLISLSYGYEIRVTLLQLACAFAMIARNGSWIEPIIIMSDTAHSTEPLYSLSSIETIKNILEATALHGTAKKSQIPGYRIMSKTGTANMLIDGTYDKERNIYTCAGIIEKDTYTRVLVVFVKEIQAPLQYAATVSAPLFERIAEKMIIHEHAF